MSLLSPPGPYISPEKMVEASAKSISRCNRGRRCRPETGRAMRRIGRPLAAKLTGEDCLAWGRRFIYFSRKEYGLLSAYAENPGREPGAECAGRTVGSAK